MKLDEAISVLTDLKTWPGLGTFKDKKLSIQLGIEALEQVKESRFDPSTWEPKPLPGETLD